MFSALNYLTRRSTAEREAAAIRRAADADVRAERATMLLDDLVRAEGMRPMSVVITSGMYRRGHNPETGDLVVKVPEPPSLHLALGNALAFLGRSL